VLTKYLSMKPDKVFLSLVLLIILTTISSITSCTHQANITGIREICFDSEVLPIFTNSCAMSGCHNGRSGRESRMALNNYADISNTVVPGNPDASRSYLAIIAKSGENMMPPRQPLSLTNRTIIRLWIEQGAKLTICDTAVKVGGGDSPVTRACFTRDILPVVVSRFATTGFHSGAFPGGNISLASYVDVNAAASNGSIMNALKGAVVPKMPKGGALSACRIRQFEIWVNNSSLNN
jgi:hypothetical protein